MVDKKRARHTRTQDDKPKTIKEKKKIQSKSPEELCVSGMVCPILIELKPHMTMHA
jgi:hypothetical protein